MGEPQRRVIWRPHPGPQTELLKCPAFEVFYGGARGGGKSDGILGEWLKHERKHGGNARALCVRRTREQLVDLIERAKQLFIPGGAKWHEQDKRFRWPSGATFRFSYLERDQDAEAVQGHNYTRVYVEELGNFPDPKPILKLMATLRSGAGVPVGFRATGNPGGPGQHWIKARYIDPAPMGWKVIKEQFDNPWTGEKVERERVYIPSRVSDNPSLGGDYVANLQMQGSPELVRAWLEGDWSAIQGAFFPEFGLHHVIAPMELPGHWLRFRSFDWGSARPFSVGWYAVSDGEMPQFPRGALVKYREWYGSNGQPNTGLKMTAEQVADGIREREEGDTITFGVADPAIFTADGGPSHAERMMARGIIFRRGDNARVQRAGAMGGWDQLRARLVGEDGRPMIYFFATCRDTIRTLPALQHDPDKPEDLDTDGEDHAADETRYACMGRPYIPARGRPPEPKVIEVGGLTTVTMDDLWRARDARRLARV